MMSCFKHDGKWRFDDSVISNTLLPNVFLQRVLVPLARKNAILKTVSICGNKIRFAGLVNKCGS